MSGWALCVHDVEIEENKSNTAPQTLTVKRQTESPWCYPVGFWRARMKWVAPGVTILAVPGSAQLQLGKEAGIWDFGTHVVCYSRQVVKQERR